MRKMLTTLGSLIKHEEDMCNDDSLGLKDFDCYFLH